MMKSIMYHYVRPNDPGLPSFRHLHIEDFAKQLDYFSSEFGFVTKEKFREALLTGNPAPGVILTFDDGFKDHYQYVLPELLKRNLWGIFYVPTFPLVSNRLIDVHRIHLLVGKFGGLAIAEAIKKMITPAMLSHAHVREFYENTYTRQKNSVDTNYVKRLLNYFIDYKHRSGIIDKLMEEYFQNEAHVAQDFYMTREELSHMSQLGMVIGSHTVSHPVMSKLSEEDQDWEIKSSFELLESVIGQNPFKTFCYPYGGFHTFTLQTEKLLEKNNCLFSFNVELRDIGERDLSSRRQALPRYDCNQFPFGQCRSSDSTID